ncbi:DUF2207 domain-containing protein [Tessaracoccus flavus]|uniref:Uncharacterized protein n=1 Tax=Tessaracoccus flavus TaxID=1610493 RepID=A0A1Q2CFY7_9ACTN|nr:DUF2207 domain-containing protein [Tessaracoccus flavus]AQP45029.1 hypothetical protein RPIT_09720 [Tessaracoccus flavus]SDY58706.1 Predicted membrane protein [Tessaracoccus flavus]
MTKMRAGLAALLLALMTVWAVSLPAAAEDSAPISRYHVDVNLTEQGVAQIRIDMVMDFSVVAGRGPILTFPLRQADGANPDENYVFDYSNFTVSSPTGANANAVQERDGDLMAIRVGREDIVNRQPHNYVISYDVTGFIVSDHPTSGLDEFNWDAIGPGWRSRFSDVRVTVTGPAAIEQTACFHGPDTRTPCESSQSGNTAEFSVASLNPRERMQVVAGFPALTFGGVEQQKERRVTAANAFELTPTTGALTGAGLVAALAGVFAIRRRHARDDVYLGLTPGLLPAAGETANIGQQSGKYPVTVQFHPPKGATPGEIGTLMDTTADNIDVSATIVDLAVRHYLRIRSDGKNEFVLEALGKPTNELAPYEKRLLADIFQGAHTRTSRQLRKAKFAEVLPNARTGLYQAVVDKGWFKSNPTTAQLVPMMLGGLIIAAGVMATLFLAQFGWGLVGIPLAVLGIGLIAISGKFRKRTARGSAYLAQAKGFELYLRTAEKETLQFEEGEDIFSKYLPYAMVFGVADRWTTLFAQLGEQGLYRADTSWYVGADLMHGFYFANAMNNLTHSMSDAMNAARMDGVSAATAGSSGFSGFSGGGGFGGGGGGSW